MVENVQRPPGDAPAGDKSEPGGPLASGSAAALREGLDQLAARNLPREAFANEALQLMIRTFGVKIAALIGCDPKRTRLWILADVGFNPKARELLASPTGRWIAMRPINDHRINVIVSALENPFVPPALCSALGLKTMSIATVPFYNGNVPVGSVVLFSPTPATFSNQLLGTLSQTLRQCARVLGETTEALAEEHGPVGKAQGNRLLETLPLQPTGSLNQPASAGRAPAAPPAAPAPAAPAPVPAEPSPVDRTLVTRLESEVAKYRTQAEQYAGQQAEMQKLHRKILDAQATAAQARGQTTVLRTALLDSRPAAAPAGGAAGNVRLPGPTFDFALRITESVGGLLNRTLGFETGQNRILKNVQQEWQQLRASIAASAVAEPEPPESTEPTEPAAAAAPAPPPAVAPAPEPEQPPGSIEMGRATDVLRQTTQYLHNAFVELDRQTFILANLRDALYSWRINRSDEDDSDADIEASGSLWELGDQMDDLVETMDNYRLHLFALSRELEMRLAPPKAPA